MIQQHRTTSSRPYTRGSFQLKLAQFEKFIKDFTYVDEELNPEERRQILQDRLANGYEPFCEKIRHLFGNDVSTQDLKALFRKLALNPEAKVDWSELFGIGGSEDKVSDLLLNDDISSVFTTSKRRTVGEAGGDKKRRDIVQTILHVPKYDFYISASQKGVVCQWSRKFRLQACTDIMESSWVTGCAFLPSLRRIAVSTERAIALWDYRDKQKKSLIFQIKRMENSPQCMIRIPWKTNSLHEDTIMFGDDQGCVNILTISSKDLHMKNSTSKNASQVISIEPSKLTNEVIRRKFHDDWVVKVKYFPQLEMFGSCSPSSSCSFILGSLERLLDSSPVREISVPKGINCFDYCTKANVIVTAGCDKIIRIWHPLIFTKPTGKLLGHLFTIVEIAVNEKDQQLISLSTARVFRVWDIQTLTCLQVFTDNEVRPGEKRISAMLFDGKHDQLITGCSVIDTWPLTRAIQDSLQVPHTHDRPISQMLYNPQTNQIISACTEGILKVWEMETGQLVYQVTEAHGSGNDITAMNVDSSGYRLVTGAYDGSIKLWDFGSGQLYKKYPESVNAKEYSITGLAFHTIDNLRCILASSWGRNIIVLEDCYDSPCLTELRTLSDVYFPLTPPLAVQDEHFPFVSKMPLPAIGCHRTEGTHALSSNEVTCLEYWPPLLIAGTSEGSILVWDLNTEKLVHRFEGPLRRSARNNKRQRQSESEKLVHCCRVVVHRVRRPIIYGSRDARRHLLLSFSGGIGDITAIAEAENEETLNEDESVVKTEPKDVEMSENSENSNEKGEKDTEMNEDDSVEEIAKQGEETELEVLEESRKPTNEPEFIKVSEPCLISCHHDGLLRFWSLNGKFLSEIRAITRKQSSAVTTLSSDADGKFVVSGDSKGYITVWEVGNFLLDPASENAMVTDQNTPSENEGETKETQNVIKQLVCWRGHLTRIVGLEHVQSADVIITASTDCSIRVWYRDTGHFIGFFGQPRLWHLPSSKSVPSTPVRPYDISEVPVKTLKHQATKQKAKTEGGVDCPLMFDDARWSPFRHSAKPEIKTVATSRNKKFFDSLSKPKHYNNHLQSSRTGSPETGAVYRALPVYTIDEPERLKTPAFNRTSSWLTKKAGKMNLSYRTSSPMKEQVVSRFPHLVMGSKR